MVDYKHKSKRKVSGGRRTSVRARDKKLFERGGIFSETKIGMATKNKNIAGLGGTSKTKLVETKFANVTDPNTHKTSKMEVVNVKENEANRVYARRQVITQNALIEVGSDKKLARVTSRPGQDGTVNAILVEKA